MTSNNLQNLSYGYDKFGNLAFRKDETRNLIESFEYDHLNRLKIIKRGSLTTGMMDYDPYGRMTGKVSDNTPIFSDARYNLTSKPHAIDEASCVYGIIPEEEQNITYTCFDKVKTITEGDNTLAYTYGYDRQRIFMEEHANGIDRTKRYVGSCEFITKTENNITTASTLTYLTSPTGVFAVVVTNADGKHYLHYILKDHLGSWSTITDCNGAVEQELSYDAWGRRRNPVGFGYGNVTCTFDRGYTLHEHYDDFDLINMNGRLYDPVLGRMLSPDIAVQDEYNAQSYNGYSYCFNNPLRFTDPSGYVVTIPPEFEKYYLPQYFDDFEAYKSELAKLGAHKVDYETNELEGGGGTITNLWWNIDDDVYRMIIVDHKLKNYQQKFKMSCVASSLAAQEQRLKGNMELTEDYFMDKTMDSYSDGLKTSKELEEYKTLSHVYPNNTYFEAVKENEYYEGYTFSEMSKNNGVLFRFYDDPFDKNNQIINHTMNASKSIGFSINNGPEKHEIIVWDSDFIDKKVGGYRPFLEFANHFYYKMGILFKK